MIDDDLQGMLEELELDNPDPQPDPGPQPEPQEEPAATEPVQEPVATEPVQEPILEDPPPQVPATVPETDLFGPEEEPDEILNITDFVRQHEHDYDSAKGNIQRDRAKADQVVSILMQRVEDGDASNQETESLVQAVKLLIDSNGHLVRLLDSKSKLLTASRGSLRTLIQQNFGGGADNAGLEDILSQSVEEDEV